MSKAIIYIILAALFFSLMQVCTKFLHHIPVIELGFFRCIIIIIVCLCIFWKKQAFPKGKNKKLLFARGLFGSIALVLFFYTLQNIPIGYAATLQHLSSIFTVLIASLFLRESASKRQWICLLVAFIGVAVIKGVDLTIPWNILGIGIISAFTASISYIIIRKMKDEDHNAIVFYFPLVGVLLFTPHTIFYWVTPKGMDWVYLISMGLVTYLAQIFMTQAYQQENASNFIHYAYIGVVFSLLLGYLVFDEHITFASFIGIAIIISAAMSSQKLKKIQVA